VLSNNARRAERKILSVHAAHIFEHRQAQKLGFETNKQKCPDDKHTS